MKIPAATAPFRSRNERTVLIGQSAGTGRGRTAGRGDESRRGLDRDVVNGIREAWPALIKPGSGAAAAVSCTAATAPGGRRRRGSPVPSDSAAAFLRRVSRRSLQRGVGLSPLSEKCELTLLQGAPDLLANSHPSALLCRTENGALQQLQRRGNLHRAPPPDRAPPGGESPPFPHKPQLAPTGGAGVPHSLHPLFFAWRFILVFLW